MGPREGEEEPYRAPVEPANKGSVGLSDPRLSESVSESLIQLGVNMQKLSMVVDYLQARADVQTEGREVRTVVSTSLDPRSNETTIGSLMCDWALATKRRWLTPPR